MFFLAHLVAALASILPLLVAIQKSRNGDFDFVYQRTIDYTSSMHLPDILGYFLQNQEDKSTSSSAPFVFDPVNVTITQQDTGHPVEFHVVTEHLGPEEGGNATEEIKSTQTHKLSFLVGRFRQVISSLRVRWNEMGIFRHVFLLFHGMVCIMDDLTDVSLAFHLNHYDFSLASPSRTSEALGNALLSVWNSLGIKTLTSSFILAILIKLSLAITYTASIGFAYYVYVLLHDLAKTREDLRRVQSIVKALETHKNSQQFNLNLQANRFENLLLEKETLQATSTQQLKEYRSENTTFQSENRSKQRQIDGAHAEIKSLHLEIDSAKSEAETQQRRADGWKQRAETAKTEQIEASRTIEVLQKQVELKQQLVNQNAVVLQNLKAEHSSERDSYNAHILQTEERIDKLEEQFHLVKNLKEQLQRELAEIDDDHSSELERLKSEHGVERDSYLAKVLASQEKIEEFKDHILQLEELHESIMVLQDHQEELQEKRSGTNDNDDNERNSHDAEILAAQERIEQLEKDLAAKGGSRRKRKRGGQDRAGSRTIIKRRNSFDTHTPVPCSACRGPRRVKVASNAKSWKPYSDEHKMDESSEVAIAESESLEAPPTTDNYDSVGAPQSGEVDLMAKQRSELGLNQDKGSLTPASGGELREATGLSISRPKPTRRRQRKKGQKQSQNQEQPQILVQSQDITAAQGNIQAHTPSALPSRWGLGGSVLPQFNNPPHPPVQPPNHLVQYPFNPSATNFWPGVHPSSPLPNRYPGPLKNQGQSGPSHSNVSKWAY